MIKRMAQARWAGKLRDGRGEFELGSGACSAEYTFASRFEQERGSNPDELLGAALASCFTMALVATLSKEGFKPERIHTFAEVSMDQNADGSFGIKSIELRTEGHVSNIEPQRFEDMAAKAKATCPVSKALAGIEIVLRSAFLSVDTGAAEQKSG